MRALVFTFLWVASAATATPAEVIHLKNGRTIWADHVHENGSHVEYEVGDDSYAVPKSSVDHIEAGGVPPASAGSAHATGAHDVPAFTPASSLKNEGELTDKVLHSGQIDGDALSALEGQGDAQATATGYFIAGRHEFDHGNFNQARSHFETGLRFDPENPTILNYLAALLVRTGNAKDALPYAEHASRIAPDSPDTLDVLGYAQYAGDRTQDAIRTWKRSLELRPDAAVQRLLEKAERDARAEAEYTEHESSHFTLRYEGKQTPDSLRREIVATLESAYDDLVLQFGIAPRQNIAVILYTEQTFFDVTQAPAWGGAINDGKLRIPIQGVSSVSPELARILKHELAHSFINQLSNGRCPTWLNEGVAQAMEPKSLSANGRRLAALFAAGREIPYNALEGAFLRYSGGEAILAYDESLAAVLYINDTYGMSDIRRLLQQLGQGSSTEAALRNTVHSGYGQFETEVGKYLVDKYGN
jgi:Peptidase MA superfamily